MELKAFADIVSEGIQKEMGEDYSISVVEKFKNKIGIEFVKKKRSQLTNPYGPYPGFTRGVQ